MITPDASGSGGGSSKTLSETTSTTIVANNSIACSNANTGLTEQNTYYRVFSLSSFGITTPFQVTSVTFQVEYAVSVPTSTLTVGTYSGTVGGTTLTAADIAAVQTDSTVSIPNADDDDPPPNPGTVTVPISATIPAGSNVAVELAVPAGGTFYIGTSSSGESDPGYVSSSGTGACSPPGATPTSMTSLGSGSEDILLTVTGTY